MSAVLFGSISTLADTSELQREAFNRAFAQHGLSWEWSREDYLAMLETSGGKDRVAEYAKSRGEDVDAAAVHATKSEIFQNSVVDAQLPPRAGVVETIRSAKSDGLKVGLVTTTSPDNVDALLEALAPEVSANDFDVIVDATSVEESKPNRAAYDYAVDKLGTAPTDCVAIEDNLGGVDAAIDAGITVVAFPNGNTAGHDFSKAARRIDHVDLGELRELISA